MPQAAPSDVVRALVVAGDARIPYLAAGRGPALILLSRSPLIRSVFLREVPRQLRLLIPDLPHDGAGGGGEWLEAFLDALGVPDAWVASDTRSSGLVTSLAAIAPDRIGGTVVVQAGGEHEDGVRACVRRLAGATGMPELAEPPSIDMRGPRPNVRE